MPVISTNTAANTAVRYLNLNSSDESDSLSKLASGSRITKASDDASGSAISTKLSSDIAVLSQASNNASDATSVLQIADGGASSIADILQRMKTLASESASGTVTDTERAYIQSEFSSLNDEITATATSTRYNGISLLDGTSSFSSGTAVVVGSDASDTITIKLSTLTASALGVSTLSVSTQTGATAALTALDTAINSVSAARASIGATESRFDFRSDSIASQQENLESANSVLADVDIATEESKLASAEVKTQAAVAAASQANQMPQELLKLMQ